jgi:hypothetical protein
MDAAQGTNLLMMDGDLILDPGSFRWTIDTLRQPSTKMVSMHHAPIEGTYPEDESLATVIRMNAIRRHTFPEKYWVHGAYIAWPADLQIGGQTMRFPAGRRVHEDNWLTAVLARDYGFPPTYEKLPPVRVTRNYLARFVPPQNWQEYMEQQWRYQFAHLDLGNEFPDLAGYIPAIREWTNAKYPEAWIDAEWRESCIKARIDFDAVIGFYKDVLQNVRNGREEAMKLLDENGVWKQQTSTKMDPALLQRRTK